MACVKNSEALQAIRVAAMMARLSAILRTVLATSAMSAFSTSPTVWFRIAGVSWANFAPHPPILAQQYQPPPNSALLLRMVSMPQFGHFRLASRHRYLDSLELQEPEPSPTSLSPR